MLRYFFILFVSSLAAVSCVSLLFYSTARHSRQKIIEYNEIISISRQEEVIRNDIQAIVADLLLLVKHYQLHTSSPRSASNTVEMVTDEFFIFARQKKIYDQVRFINNRGMEQIRINYTNGNTAVVPAEQLQFKGKRYYFKDTFKLQEGEVFISPFDLNIEQGVIEQPKKPMIRFGTPVFNRRGEKEGIINLLTI
ncbi:MAG: hypothetical protein D3910_05750 [Candidatus Electrothrix sp. ATG2]|nr:hypothetical protein [Candidatus Electrothrix sp. ATG2]